ncbi:MAG: molybdopterin-dependent oxidoreductase [Caldilineaceae bacterium]|nr:molybdopterin-dependent oxidoreductase [Caldilineaceae bacterium]
MTRRDPLAPHSHEPNPLPPSPDAELTVHLPDGTAHRITPAALSSLEFLPTDRLPPAHAASALQVTVPNCYIVSTGHGTSGPFSFTGLRLLDLVDLLWPADWTQVEVVSGDGFGTRALRTELTQPTQRPVILAHTLDRQPLSRAEGLVRLIVPSETDDALRQVKWVAHVRIISDT